MKRMKKAQSGEDTKAATDANKIKKRQSAIARKFNYLKGVDDTMFTYTFLRAQAEEICDMLSILKMGPFKGLYGKYKDMISDKEFIKDFYIKLNEYKDPEPDFERLSKWLPLKIIINQ